MMDTAENTTTRITKPMKTTTAVSLRGNVKADIHMKYRVCKVPVLLA